MDEHRQSDIAESAEARAQWVHDLRNVVNTAGASAALARRLMERGDTAAALEMLARADGAWARCRDLLLMAGQATVLDQMRTVRPPGEGARSPSAPPPHR